MKKIRDEIFAQRRFRQLLLILVIVSILLGLVVVPIERTIGQITTVEEGLWWAVTTVSGVGYGDFVPVTTAGRIIGGALQLMGTVMFGLLVGLLSAVITRRQEEIYWAREFERFAEMDDKMNTIEKKLDFLVRDHVEPKRGK